MEPLVSAEYSSTSRSLWMQWARNCGDKLIDLGSPLMNGQQLTPGGTGRNSESDIVGYSILQADNMEQAKALLQSHPHLGWNADCSIEVHETMPLPGM